MMRICSLEIEIEQQKKEKKMKSNVCGDTEIVINNAISFVPFIGAARATRPPTAAAVPQNGLRRMRLTHSGS